MNYPLKSKPGKSPNRNKIILIAVVFLILLGTSFFFAPSARSGGRSVLTPLWSVRTAVLRPFSAIGQFFSFKTTLIEKNKVLEEENATLRLKSFDYDILLQENESLKSSLGRKENESFLFAKVLSKPPVSPYDTLVLDIGSEDGVMLGSKVYLSSNVIIGLVKNVTPKTALVELFSSSSQENQLTVLRTGSSFLIAGKGGGNLQLEVPKDTDIVWGDVFVYPDLKTSVLGTVYYVDATSQGSFKTIHIRLFANIFEINSVFVAR
ncbi:MAG: rod shape-determining protein MreC [Patescibacteria group bacterium]